jgi:hypothetical protein
LIVLYGKNSQNVALVAELAHLYVLLVRASIFRKTHMVLKENVFVAGIPADSHFSPSTLQDITHVPCKVNAGVNAFCISSLTCPTALAYLVALVADAVHAPVR